jgi:phage terminase large subunit GpA-like protein
LIATAEAKEEGVYSYHVSSLYAPVGMKGWYDYASEFVKACPPGEPVNQALLKTFLNTALGQTWEEKSKKNDAKSISLNTRGYDIGVIPEKISIEDGNGRIVMVTCGADLGGTVYNEEKGTVDDARLDYEIVAWSENGTPYSVDHGSIGTFVARENQMKVKADRDKWTYAFGVNGEELPNSVWAEFKRLLTREWVTDNDTGTRRIACTALDSSYFTKFAYQFTDNCLRDQIICFPIKGEPGYRRTEADTKAFRHAKERIGLYKLDVNKIKDELSGAMMLKWSEGAEQPVGFMNFPTPADGKYTYKDFFAHFESEHRIIRKSTAANSSSYMWAKKNDRIANHLWDCRIYNMAVKDIFTHLVCKENQIDESWGNYCYIMK